MKEINMRSIGCFLLLFSCILTNMTHSMEEQQRCAQAVSDYYTNQAYAQVVAQRRYAEQRNAQAQYYPQPQFTPHALDDYFSSSHYFQPSPNTSRNFSQPTNLSNPNRPYNLQPQQTMNSAYLDDFRTASQSQVARPVRSRKRKLVSQDKTTGTILESNHSAPSSKIRKLWPAYLDFILECPSCEKRIYSLVKDDLRHKIGKHSKSECQLTKEEIAQSLKKIVEPKKIRQFTVPCPFQTCITILKAHRKKNKLRPILLAHLKKSHENYQEEHPIRKLVKKEKAFEKYFKEHGKTAPIPNPKYSKEKISSKPGKLTN